MFVYDNHAKKQGRVVCGIVADGVAVTIVNVGVDNERGVLHEVIM